MTPLAFVVHAQRFPDRGQRIDAAVRPHAHRLAREFAHQRVHVFELLQRRPIGVARAPVGSRSEPDRERLGEVLVRDGSARTSCPGGARNSCCTAAACSPRDRPCPTARRPAAGVGAAAADTRCRSHAPPHGAGFACTTPACLLRPRASARVRGSRVSGARDRTGSRRRARRQG